MFIVENGLILGNKTFDIGKSRVVNLVFKFTDTAFDDDDKFQLDLGGNKFSLYGFTDAGCLRFTAVELDFIASETTSAPVKITCNEDEILSDTITIKAVVTGGGSADLSAYVGGVSITGDVNGSTADILNYTKTGKLGSVTVGWNQPNNIAQPDADTYNNNLFVKGWNLGIIGGYQVLINAGGQTITVNKSQGIFLDASNLNWNGSGLNRGSGLCLLNETGNVPFYVSEPYINENDSHGDIWFRFNSDSKLDWYTHRGAALTFYDDGDFQFQYPDTLTKRMDDNCITKEIWVTPSGQNITTISIPEYIQVIGDMPQTLQATKEILWNETPYTRALTHVFVVRGINYNGRWIYTINYSYNFISDYNSIFN